MKKFFLLNLCLIGIVTSAHADKVYKWSDEKGHVHYSTFPPAKADAEEVHVPSSVSPPAKLKKGPRSSSSRHRNLWKSDTYSSQAAERDEKRAAEAYNRKYGAEARLKRRKAEERKKKAREDQINRQRERQNVQQQREQRHKEKRAQLEAKRAGLVAQCEDAHETDCENPAFLKKWLKKKYGRK